MSVKNLWNTFFDQNPYLNGKAPSQFLEKNYERLTKGKLLDVAMGEGQNAAFLAGLGFEVTGVDISDLAAERAKALAYEKDVKIETKSADLDMFLLGVMEYDTVIMTNYKPSTDRFYPEMIKSLKQGGTLLIEFDANLLEKFETTAPTIHFKLYKENELLRQMKGLRIIHYSEEDHPAGTSVRLIAKKPVDSDAQKYDLFGMAAKDTEKKSQKQLDLAESLFKK